MPKFLPISDFAQAGLNSDLLAWDLPPSYLTEIRNIRIHSNRLTPNGGYSGWAMLPGDSDPGLLLHGGGTTNSNWVIAGDEKVYAYDGGSFGDISSVAGYAAINNGDLWTGCLMSEVVILNHPQIAPEYWPQQSLGVPLEPLPWDAGSTWEDAGEKCRIMRSHKQFLFALDITTGLDEYRDGVRWSAPADIGGVPPTWDHLDITNFAGLTFLGGSGGNIVDGLSLRDAFVIYREGAITVFDFVGGQYVWRVRELSNTVGLISDDCIVEVKGVHFFISDGDILSNDGNTVTSIMHNRIRRRFHGDLDPASYDKAFAIRHDLAHEIWFCIPTAKSIYANTAYIYNWKDDTWSIRDIPLSTSGDYGRQSSPPTTWENIQGDWDEIIGDWTEGTDNPLTDTIVLSAKDLEDTGNNWLLFPDHGSINPLTAFDCNIERVSVPLEGLNNVTTITRVYPHMAGPGSCYIQVGSQDFPGAPTRWKQPVLFNPEADRKVDIRTTGELHCFRIYSDQITSTWSISGMDIDYVMAGIR